MKVNYNTGTLEIDLHGLLMDIAPEKRVELIESLACDDAIIKHVADQIIDRWTENSCRGGSVVTVPADASKSCPLDHAWRRVAKASGDVAKYEIEKMERGLAHRDKQIADLHEGIRKSNENHASLLGNPERPGATGGADGSEPGEGGGE